MARDLVHPSLNSPEAVEDICDQRRLWSDCADTQVDLRLRWSHKSYCRFCRALTLIILAYSLYLLDAGHWTSSSIKERLYNMVHDSRVFDRIIPYTTVLDIHVTPLKRTDQTPRVLYSNINVYSHQENMPI